MSELMETFCSCAGKILVADILKKDGEYLSRTRCMESGRKRLAAAPDKSTALRVDELLCEQAAIDGLRGRAAGARLFPRRVPDGAGADPLRGRGPASRFPALRQATGPA